MKTIVEINSNNYASTGNIMLDIAKEARKNGYKVYSSCKKSRKSLSIHNSDHLYIGFWLERVISERIAYITGLKNHFNIFGTLKFISNLNKIKPDLIHIHSLIDTYININILFKYIKRNSIPVVWTAHDVWNVSGQCRSFDLVGCEKWKTGCGNCPLVHYYPASLVFDTSHKQFVEKRKWFSNVNMRIITPSKWLENIISNSYQKNYPIETIYNGIDTSVFKPTYNTFKKDNNIENKYMLLGVGYGWSYEKGLDVFIELAKRLPNNYQIVLVGTNDEIDAELPNDIISIHKTYNREELARIYSAADLFVNPTRADNFPTVNIEALSCGTPVITFNTGGSPEAIDETCGITVEKNDINSMEKKIRNICENKLFTKENCLQRAKQFNKVDKYKEYINLFNKILNN